MSEAEIQSKRRIVRGKNKSLKPDRNEDSRRIIWDPHSYSFAVGSDDDAPKFTVERYYRERYGIQLQHPKMPIVHVGRGNWFPVEFLYQAYGKAKDANTPENVRRILAEKDSTAGIKLLNYIRGVFASFLPEVGANLESCNIQISEAPMELSAKILPNPHIMFQNTSGTVNNGSWNLQNAHFSNVADLSSFGLLDLTGGQWRDFLSLQFEAIGRHGMELPNTPAVCANDIARQVCVSENRPLTPERLELDLSRAVSKARDFFVHDREHHYRANNTWFKSRCIDPETMQSSECLVIPHPSPELVPIDEKDGNSKFVVRNQEVGLMLPREVHAETHQVTVIESNKTGPARLMVGVTIDGQRNVVDPFSTRWWNNCYQAKLNGVWRTASFGTFLYQRLRQEYTDFEEPLLPNEVSICIPSILVPAHSIEGPAAIFVYLPEANTDYYNVIKMHSTFEHGIPTQVAVERSFDAQRNKLAYCSNIALKLNGKMSNQWNEGRAWALRMNGSGAGLKWYSDTETDPLKWIPTMLIGLSMARGQGQAAPTIVAATACLDKIGMQTCSTIKVQDQDSFNLDDRNTSAVAGTVLKDIVYELATQFYRHNDEYPKRVLIYRDGLSDGNFAASRGEIQAIRQAFHDLKASKKDFQCKNSVKCQKKGCIMCTPLITYITCQDDHGINLVPESASQEKTVRGIINVHSGTVVDSGIIEEMPNVALDEEVQRSPACMFRRVEESSYDFLLTPHGGLKGSSKPVYYRVLLNENDIYVSGGSPLSRTDLEALTYQQSFLYSTATKATRSVPVVQYSKNLASQAMGWIGYLLLRERIVCERNDDGQTEYFRVDSANTRSKQLLPAFAPYDPANPRNSRPPFRPCGLICAKSKKG